MAVRSLAFLALTVFSLVVFLGGYALLRLLKIPLHWVVRGIGGVILLVSVAFCIWILLTGAEGPGHDIKTLSSAQMAGMGGRSLVVSMLATIFPGRTGTLLGALAVPIALYAACSWVVRQGYVLSKRRVWKRLSAHLRSLFLFVREHHQFFGIVVIVAALAHMMQYLPVLSHSDTYEIITGFVAIGVLGLMVILGLWVWIATLKKNVPPRIIRNTHAALTIIFLGALMLHV